jgi:hypothetical protein
MTCQYHTKTTIITLRLKLLQEIDLNKHAYLPVLMIMSAILICQLAQASPDVDSEWTGLADYPRIEHFEHGNVQVDFPTLDAWPDFRYLKAWLPVEVSLNGESKPHVGSLYVQATTEIDFDRRTVNIFGLNVLKTKFSDEGKSDAVTKLTGQAFQGRERTVPLDVLLRLLPEHFEIPGQGGELPRFNFDPPVIRISQSPLKLLSIDKEPVRAPIEGTELDFVVNTNWNVFYNRAEERWYVLNDGVWQQNNYLSDGGWTTTVKLPSDFDTLVNDDRWQEVRKALPLKEPAQPPVPFIISLQATELILLDGEPHLKTIEETGISYVSNTRSDLFSYEGRWYFLVSGRWFSNSKLGGQWQSVRNLPDVFARIPANHDKGHVLFSVPGTRQARLAMIEAALPHRVTVSRDAYAELELTWVGEPRFEPIETTQLERGLNTPLQIIRHNNFYYLCYEGAWYFSALPEGPWKVALQIPDEIYRIPVTDPAFNVTFVRLDQHQVETQDYVNYNYSSGYTGSFSTTVSVIYGTGWHHSSSVYWDTRRRPYYWHYGWAYGHNIGYRPVGAYYGGRYGYYNPWGGYYGRTTVTLASPSVNFTHGFGSVWEGPFQTMPGYPDEAGDNPLDDLLPEKKIDGTEEFIDTSKDTAAAPAKVSAASLISSSTISSNRFSGSDGEVYKHENQQWSQYSDGNWTTMQAIEQNYRSQSQPQRRPQTQQAKRWLPAHKRTLSRSELDRQELARIEGMESYSKYRMEKEAANQ